MKKIFLKENSISNILKNRLLPEFIFGLVKTHETSLGNNSMFPSGGEYPFDYTILKLRYNDVCEALEELNLPSIDEDSLMTELSESVKLCKDMEVPVRDSLEKICENSVNRLFAIPEDILNLDVKLVDKVRFKKSVRLRPESSEDMEYTFSDVSDMGLFDNEVEKRRFINSLIQGAAYTYSNIIGLYIEDIDRINSSLIPLYNKIRVINDYLLFTKKEEMSDKDPMQGSYVEVSLGTGDDGKSTIKAQGLIFPLLLQETIKGMFELFSTHGLPQDKERAVSVVKKADFVLAEPWDMRFGVSLWNKIFGTVEDTNMIPYMFTSLVSLPYEEFVPYVKEILASTRKGKEIVNDLMKQAEYDSGYQQFQNRINAKNVDKSLIKDSYFNGAETNGYEIDSNTDEGDVIEEEEDSETMGQYEAEPTKPIEYYQQLIQSATVENIDFIEGNANGTTEDLIVTINGEIIPRALILLMVQSVKIRISEYERVPMIQVHIILNDGIQRLGLAPKIYKKLIYTFGPIYSGEGRRINKEHIAKVYAKLAQDPNLYVYHDDMCYIAMLNNSLQENYKQGKTLLTESWSKTKKTIIRRTIDILRDNMPWASEMDLKNYEGEILKDYFHGAKAGDPKFRPYEQIIAKILVEDLGYPDCIGDADNVRELKRIFDYIYLQIQNDETPDIYYKYNDVTKRMEGDDFNSIYNKYHNKVKEYQEKAKDNLKTNGTNSSYTIHEVPSFEEAHKYAPYSYDGLPLCFTTGNGMWNEFTRNGSRTAYVCLKDGWKDVAQQEGENTPYDDYGLSMIWIFVDDDGELTNCCIRWNHHNEGRMKSFNYGGFNADNALSVDSIESVVGVNFDSAFVPMAVIRKKEELKEIISRLKSGESFLDVFDENSCTKIDKYLWRIYFKGKFNLIDERIPNEFVHPEIWFDACGKNDRFIKFGGIGCVDIYLNDDKTIKNIIDENGNFLLPKNMWANSIQKVWSFIKVKKNNKINFFDKNLRPILPKWAVSYTKHSDYLFVLFGDGSLSLVDEKGNIKDAQEIINDYISGRNNDSVNKVVGEEEIDIYNIDAETSKIRIGEYYNILKNDGSLISPYFFNSMEDVDGDKLYTCSFYDGNRKYYNILKPDGKFLLDLPFDCLPNSIAVLDNYFICSFGDDGIDDGVNNERWNIVNQSGSFLLKGNYNEWPQSIYCADYNDEKMFVVYYKENGDKYNIYNAETDEFLWKRPRNEWFTKLDKSSFLNDTFEVHLNNKVNYINSLTGELLIKEEPQNWYNNIEFIETGENYQIKFLRAARYDGDSYRFNVFLDNGNTKLFDENNLCKEVKTLKNSLLRIKNEEDKFNVFDLTTRSFISSQWFDDCKENETVNGRVYLFSGKDEYVYNVEDKTLVHVNEYRQNWLQNAKPEDIEGTQVVDANSLKTQQISELIPNKMYRIRFFNGYDTVANVLVKNNDHYEYLFDEWYKRIPKPVGDALCLFKQKGMNIADIYNISANKMAFTDVNYVNDVDQVDELIYIKSPEGDCNAIDSNCNLIFDGSIGKLKNLFCIDDNMLMVTFWDGTKNMYNMETHKFISNENHYNFTKDKNAPKDVFFISEEEKDQNSPYQYKMNILGQNGEPLLNTWYVAICAVNNDYAMVGNFKPKPYFNYVNMRTGEYLSDKPLDYTNGGVSRIEKNGKVNFISKDIQIGDEITLLLDEWADSASEIDGRGYVEIIYGNNTFLYKAEDGKLIDVYDEGERAIPNDFTDYQGNRINLIDHTLIYKYIGCREGNSEDTTIHNQKVTVIAKDGRKLEKIYGQRQSESCFWTMYGIYENLCRQLGIEPASIKYYQ